ncbi:hypothetical protein CK203_029237 [Vitis vinifera]|uniref:Reverse transcriptase/retrotransposon-derived protein RNase H-like domain-containing protein n=1 Tax=Vitis vinifera TaxID=29760 RepID=A0A438IT48_VITVI|nr:hypothetical protein CK203_029237 [Vitis vinifera]
MHVDKKELQRLTSRLAALRRFIARFTNKPRPFFLTLNGASTTSWMGECGQAFEEVKHYLTKPPIPSSPQSGEQFYMYLAISDCVVNAILFRHIGDKEQRLVYYMSKAMVDVETWYSRMEQTVLVMKSAAQKLRSYFQAHQVTVLTNQPLKSTLHKPNLSGQTSPKPSHPDESHGKGWWTLHMDETFRASGSGVGLILQSPIGKLLEYAIRLIFFASNNEAEYETVLAKLDRFG